MTITENLARLGISLPAVASPVGTYVPARRHGDLIYTSGQLPFVTGQLAATGTVGTGSQGVSPDEAAECAVIAVLAAVEAAADAAGGVDSLAGIVRLTGYVATSPGFTALPAVLNPASALLGAIFGDAGRHARSVVGVATLPLGSPVEVDLTVAMRTP